MGGAKLFVKVSKRRQNTNAMGHIKYLPRWIDHAVIRAYLCNNDMHMACLPSAIVCTYAVEWVPTYDVAKVLECDTRERVNTWTWVQFVLTTSVDTFGRCLSAGLSQ